jgi:hypothetical protein
LFFIIWLKSGKHSAVAVCMLQRETPKWHRRKRILDYYSTVGAVCLTSTKSITKERFAADFNEHIKNNCSTFFFFFIKNCQEIGRRNKKKYCSLKTTLFSGKKNYSGIFSTRRFCLPFLRLRTVFAKSKIVF